MPRILCDASIFVPAKGQMLNFDDGLESCQQRRPFGVNALRRSPVRGICEELDVLRMPGFPSPSSRSGTLAQTRVDLPRFYLRLGLPSLVQKEANKANQQDKSLNSSIYKFFNGSIIPKPVPTNNPTEASQFPATALQSQLPRETPVTCIQPRKNTAARPRREAIEQGYQLRPTCPSHQYGHNFYTRPNGRIPSSPCTGAKKTDVNQDWRPKAIVTYRVTKKSCQWIPQWRRQRSEEGCTVRVR